VTVAPKSGAALIPPPSASSPSPPPAYADPFRKPVVRQAMHLLVPRAGNKVTRVEFLETRVGVRLSLDIDDDGIGVKSVDLSLTEAVKLGDMLSAVRRRVFARKEWDM
jgi:hypothetical protein